MKKEMSPIIGLFIISAFVLVFVSIYPSLGAYSLPSYNMAAAAANSQGSGNDLAPQIHLLSVQVVDLNVQMAETINAAKKLSAPGDLAQNARVLAQTARQRKIFMKQLMKLSPVTFNALAIPKDQRLALPVAIQPDIELYTSVTGKLQVVHIDDFAHDADRFTYIVSTPDVKYSFYPSNDVSVRSDTSVTVSGYVLDDQLSADTGRNPIGKLDSGPAITATGPQRVLMLLLKATSTTTESFSAAQLSNLVFNGNFQKFMTEQSYGNVSFLGTTYGWYVLNHRLDCYTGGSVFPTEQELSQVITTYGIDLSKFDRIVYFSAGPTAGGCSTVGKTSVKVNGTTYLLSESTIDGTFAYDQQSFWGPQPFPWTNLDSVLSHEMGHALGLMHANGWTCSDGSILYGLCSHQEYGNYYDTMGTRGYALDYNAYFKQLLSWIPASQAIDVQQSGSYTIKPLEITSGTKAANIFTSTPQTKSYVVEFRQAIGFDSNLNNAQYSSNKSGIFVNKIQSNQSNATELLDMTPSTSSANWVDAIKTATLNLLPASSSLSSFVDSGRGITIGPVTNVSSSSITFNVQVSRPICQRLVPDISVVLTTGILNPGAVGTVVVNAGNKDSFTCGSSLFIISADLPSGWILGPYPPVDQTLQPDEVQQLGLNFTLPTSAVAGVYTVPINITNKTSGLKSTFSISVRVLPLITITSITPSTAKPSGTITIAGTGFSDSANIVFLNGVDGYSNSGLLPSSGGSITYVIPTTITNCLTSPCRNLAITDGDYILTVIANGGSGHSTLHVSSIGAPPTVVVTGSSTLTIVYDPAGKEAGLQSLFNVAVSANGSDTKVPKVNAFGMYITTGPSYGSNGTQQYNQPTGTSDDGSGNYVIPAGRTAIFNVAGTFNPKKLFAGTYHVVMDGIFMGATGNIQYTRIPSPNITNDKLIVGEVSPFINSISAATIASDAQLTITGVRFATTNNTVNLVNQTSGTRRSIPGVASSNNGTTIRVVPGVVAGSYNLSVTDPVNGDSNQILLMVTPPVSTPTATFTIEGQHSYTYIVGQTNHYVWSSTNADRFSSSYTSNNPTKCGQGSWVANTASGNSSSYLPSAYAGCIWTVTYTATNSSSGLSASDTVVVTVAGNGQPTATFTIEGQHQYTYTVGQTNHYVWSSTDADTFSSSYTSTGPASCGSGPWVANTASGNSSSYLSSSYVNCVWTVTYTARNSQSGLSASDTVVVTVNPAPSAPFPPPNNSSAVLNSFQSFLKAISL